MATLRAVTEGTKRDAEVVERAGWWANHTSVATRLAMAVLFVSITAIIVSVFVASIGAGSEGEDLLHTRLSTLGGEKVAELGFYLEEVVAEVEALGLSPAGIDGVQAFTEGYGELASVTIEDVPEELDTLADFYFDDFVPMLEEVRGEPVDILELTTGLEPAAISLQSTYIAKNPFELGEKRLVTDGEDGSTWTEVHKEYHPTLRSAADQLELDDIYLIEPETLTVVYSVEKDIDFATSLDSGSFSGTALAQVVRDVVAANEPGAVFASDFSSYEPAFDAPEAFFATGLFEGDELVGVLAARMPDEVIDEIMTRDWRLDCAARPASRTWWGPTAACGRTPVPSSRIPTRIWFVWTRLGQPAVRNRRRWRPWARRCSSRRPTARRSGPRSTASPGS